MLVLVCSIYLLSSKQSLVKCQTVSLTLIKCAILATQISYFYGAIIVIVLCKLHAAINHMYTYVSYEFSKMS